MSGTGWRTYGSLSDFGGMTIVVCGLMAFGLFSASFRKSPEAWLCMLILVAALVGAWLYGGHGRRERKYLSDYCERFDPLERADIALLEGCRERSTRRDAIRLGLIQDDGLSNLGRELAASTELAKRVSKLEA